MWQHSGIIIGFSIYLRYATNTGNHISVGLFLTYTHSHESKFNPSFYFYSGVTLESKLFKVIVCYGEARSENLFENHLTYQLL